MAYFLLLLLCVTSALGEVYRLKTSEDFANFVYSVNGGKFYTGDTIYLDSDLSLPNVTSSIGDSENGQFQGTFDGQGHVLSDYVISNSTTGYTALFGYTSGVVIRNIILDDSCSVINSYVGTGIVYAAGLVGYCWNDCTLKSSVTMASVLYNGIDTGTYTSAGGISGAFAYYAYMYNCANFGSITYSGQGHGVRIGGIGSSFVHLHAYNCLNYGTITFNGTSTYYLYIGGIGGYCYSGAMENMINAGNIYIKNAPSTTAKGTLMGEHYDITVSRCYFTTSTTDVNTIIGNEYGSGSYTNTPTTITAINTAVSAMSSYASGKGWNPWIINSNKAVAKFIVNNNKGFKISTPGMIRPDLSTGDSTYFDGWYSDPLCTVSYNPTSISTDSVLYALYGTIVTVTFSTTEGTVTPSSKRVAVNGAYGFLPVAVNGEYTFAGWFTSDNVSITNESVVNITSGHTLYALWGPPQYTITFDSNGGSVCDSIKQESNTSLLLPEPNRTGYTFVHWCSDDGLTTKYNSTVMGNKSITVYALWEANKYTVYFNVSGGEELIGYEDGIEFTFDQTYDSLPEPTKKGYDFDGWVTEGNELISIETIVNITNNCTFHANWTAKTFNITFNVNGGVEIVNATVTYDGTYDCLQIPTKDGCDFLWWYIEDTLEIINKNTLVGTACDHTICAAWNKNTISFDVNGGSALPADKIKMEVIYNGNYENIPEPEREGYTFGGWFTEDGKEEIKTGSGITIWRNQTIIAKWTPNDYTMPLNVSGGNALGVDSVKVKFDGEYGYIPTPTRTGYTFAGWYTENNRFVTSNTIVKEPCGCTLHAEWVPNKFTIIFVLNGGKLPEDDMNITVTYDGIYGELPTPTKEGYSFGGWFNESNIEITNETLVEVANNQTFTAEWIPNEYTVEFDPDGGVLADDKSKIKVAYNNFYEELPIPTKEGYEFVGWFTEGNEEVTIETTVTIMCDHTLYAHWVAITSSQSVIPTVFVEIVFGKEDMSEEEIYDILTKFTEKKFEIMRIEHTDSGETIVIIKFNDVDDAEKFIRAINGSSEAARYFIRSASFNSGVDRSISAVLYPLILLSVLLI